VTFQTGGVRAGELSLRSQRMTLHMLEAVRLEAAKIALALNTPDGEPVTRNGGRYLPASNTFVSLCATVQNTSGMLHSSAMLRHL
jgi:trafficking protein particle complex subunit 9